MQFILGSEGWWCFKDQGDVAALKGVVVNYKGV